MTDSDLNASSDLASELYDRLRAFAKSRFTQNDSLFGTELVHEAYLRVSNGKSGWESKAHFFGAIRNAMRNTIVDHLRKKGAEKHGGNHHRIGTDVGELDFESRPELPQLAALNDALNELQTHDERAAHVVTLKFFACMSEDEIAEEMNTSKRTVSRDWSYACNYFDPSSPFNASSYLSRFFLNSVFALGPASR